MKLLKFLLPILALLQAAHRDEAGGFWLWKYFKSLKSFDSDAQTEVFDLPKKGIISNIILEIQATAGTTNQDIYMSDIISKIEVIGNGSTVIQSLTGLQVQASQAYDDGQMPPDKEYSVSGACWGYFDIRFGRYPGDPKYALDCSKWDSLELKVTYTVAAGGTLGTTGYTTATGKLTMYGLFSADGAGLSPVGYIKKEQKKTYTSSASGSEDLALPNDYPYRRILLAISTHKYVPYQAYQYVTININSGARKPIDNMLGNDLMVLDLAMRGNPRWHHMKRYYLLTTSSPMQPPIGWMSGMFITGIGNTVASTTNDNNIIDVAMSAAGQAHVDVFGYCPCRAMVIDLEKWSGGKDGRDAMVDVFGYDQTADIHLEHTQQTASIAEQIVLEQYATK